MVQSKEESIDRLLRDGTTIIRKKVPRGSTLIKRQYYRCKKEGTERLNTKEVLREGTKKKKKRIEATTSPSLTPFT